jgi:hypothetical protein
LAIVHWNRAFVADPKPNCAIGGIIALTSNDIEAESVLGLFEHAPAAVFG